MTRLFACLFLLVGLVVPAGAADLSVFAAASLTEALTALAADYRQEHPGLSLALVTDASGTLLRRMQAGETPDVFVSADTVTMDMAVATGRVDPASRVAVAGNALVMAVPAGNPAGVTGLESLTMGGVRRVGVGNPEAVPAGRYAKRALAHDALWFALSAKLVYYPTVRHVLAALTGRKVDAGFVYRTDAILAGQPVAIVATLPLTPPVVYVAALATPVRHREQAAAFLDYLRSPQARAVFARFGFTEP